MSRIESFPQSDNEPPSNSDLMDASSGRHKLVHEFMSFTGTEDEGRASSFLEASSWKLPEAVQLFYAEQAVTSPKDAGASASTAAQVVEEEDVRAPLPSKFERLVDRSAQYEHLLQRKAKQEPVYEAFRNHTAELAEYEHGPNAEGGTTGLAKLYKAPVEILFRGSFEDAKEKAMKKNIWLMVNIQSAGEFASLRLNSDTFSNDALKEMIRANFVFLQTYNDGVTGQKLMHYYQIEQFPCILIIDPVTGGLMQRFSGFVEADMLIEDVVEYMDCSPNDGCASKLMKRLHKGKSNVHADDDNDVKNTEQSAGGVLIEEDERSDSSDACYGAEEVDEEADLKHVSQKRRSSDPVEDHGMDNSQPAISAVPDAAGEDTCTIGIHLPNGNRLQRLFYKHDRVESLYGFCSAEYEEAKSRPYKLKPRMPGSRPLEDLSMSLESAQVEGALLTLIWDA